MHTVRRSLRDRLAVGRTGMTVSPACLGMVRDPRLVLDAFDCGINFFFVTADMHWPLYDGIRRGLAELFHARPGSRDEVVVAAVSYVSDPAFLVQPFRELLEAVPGLGRLDITVAGVCYPTQPEFCSFPFRELVDAVPGLRRLDVLLAGGAYGAEVGARLPVYERHREERFLGNRAIGATFHDRAAAATALRHGGLDIAFVRYNADHSGARDDLFPRVPERPRPLLFNFKSTSGWVPPGRMAEIGLVAPDYWQPEVTDHYRFAFTRPQLDGLLVASRTPREVEGLAAALERGPLTGEEETYLIDVAAVARGAARVIPEGETT